MAAKQERYTAALKGDRTVLELARQFGLRPTRIRDWKEQLLTGAEQVFAGGAQADTAADAQSREVGLFEQISRGRGAPDWRSLMLTCAWNWRGGPTWPAT